MGLAAKAQSGGVERACHERGAFQVQQIAWIGIVRLPPSAHQLPFRLLLWIERADVFPGILCERAPHPVDKMAAIGKELRIAMDDFLPRGIQMGCWSGRAAAGRNAKKPAPGLLRLKQDDTC